MSNVWAGRLQLCRTAVDSGTLLQEREWSTCCRDDSPCAHRFRQTTLLHLWDDEQCPEFSAVRAILIWLAISGIKSGKIFPGLDAFSADNRNSLHTDSPEERLGCKDFVDIVHELGVTVLNMEAKSDDTLFGPRMLEKTGFLLAVSVHAPIPQQLQARQHSHRRVLRPHAKRKA